MAFALLGTKSALLRCQSLSLQLSNS